MHGSVEILCRNLYNYILKNIRKLSSAGRCSNIYLKHVCLIVGSEQIPIKNLRVFLKSNKEFPIGTTVKISGKLEEIPEPRNPGEFDSRQFYACQKIYYFMKNGVVLAWSSKYSRYGQFMQNLKSKIMQTLDIAAKEDAGILKQCCLVRKIT